MAECGDHTDEPKIKRKRKSGIEESDVELKPLPNQADEWAKYAPFNKQSSGGIASWTVFGIEVDYIDMVDFPGGFQPRFQL
jgi:hypothetical protein